jgi:hypothetical protein
MTEHLLILNPCPLRFQYFAEIITALLPLANVKFLVEHSYLSLATVPVFFSYSVNWSSVCTADHVLLSPALARGNCVNALSCTWG